MFFSYPRQNFGKNVLHKRSPGILLASTIFKVIKLRVNRQRVLVYVKVPNYETTTTDKF